MFTHRLESWTLYSNEDVLKDELLNKLTAKLSDSTPICIFFNSEIKTPSIFPRRKILSLRRNHVLNFVPDCRNMIVVIHDSLKHERDMRDYLEVAHIDYAWRNIISGVSASAHFLEWPHCNDNMTDTQLLALAEMFQDITNSGLLRFKENALCFKQICEISNYFEPVAFSRDAIPLSSPTDSSNRGNNNNAGTTCLDGLRVTIIRESIVPWDLRLYNQSKILADAGAIVRVIGKLEGNCTCFLDERVRFCDTKLPPVKLPRLGREDVWYPVRVLTNLTWTRSLSASRKLRVVRKIMSLTSLSETIKRTEADILHIYDVHLVRDAFKAAAKTKAKVILDIRDLIAAEGYTAGLKGRFYQSLEQKYVPLADKMISVSRPSADYLQEKYSLKDIDVISNVLPKPTRFTPDKSDKIRFLFQGAYRPNRNLLALIRAMNEVRGKAELTLQGWGLMQPLMELLVKQLRLENTVHFAAPCAPQDTGEFAKQFDFGIICYSGSTTNLQLTVPVKLFAYLNAGLPTVVTDLPGPRSILGDSTAASYIETATWEGIAKTLKAITESEIDLDKRRNAAYELADIYSWENEGEKYIQIIKELRAEQES